MTSHETRKYYIINRGVLKQAWFTLGLNDRNIRPRMRAPILF